LTSAYGQSRKRAECVMLNKGPYIDDAITALDDILSRMGAHQRKKTPSCDPSGAGPPRIEVGY